MKRFFTLLILVFGSIALVQAQVTLTHKSHGFIDGLTHSTQEVTYQDPGESGINQIWDFSHAELRENPSVSFAEMFDCEDVAANIKVVRDDNVDFLYNLTESGNEYVGYSVRNVKVTYSKPILKTKYPQSYGTFFEGNFEGTRVYDNQFTSPIKGYYSTDADATGTIILPNGNSYPALRVHTIERIEENNGTFYEIDKFLWYLQDVRLPVFVSIQNYSLKTNGTRALRSQKSFYTPSMLRVSNDVTAMQDIENGFSYTVSPNPFKDVIQLSYTLSSQTEVTIDLYNSKGVKLTTLVNSELQNGSISISENVSKYTSVQDTYLLRMQFGAKVYTEKLMKAK